MGGVANDGVRGERVGTGLRWPKSQPWSRWLLATSIFHCGFHWGCNNDGSGSKKPIPELEGDACQDCASAARGAGDSGGPIDFEKLVPPGSALLEATYQLSAKAAGIELCDGFITMRINAAIGQSNNNVSLFELPTSEIDCALIGKLNLKPIVGIYSDSDALPKPIVENNVLFFDRIGATNFRPARPFLPSFLASSREELKNLRVSRQVTVTDQKRNKSATGTMSLKMLSFGVPFQAPLLNQSFSDTFTFENTNTGFEGIDKASNVIFDRIAMTMSLKPVAILALSFSGDAQSLKQSAVSNPDLIPGPFGQLITVLPDANTGGLGGLIGTLVDSIARIIKVDLQLTLKEQAGLKPGAGPSSDGSDDGVQIGGQLTKGGKQALGSQR